MSDHPHTREAMERWQQGKINVFDALAELEDQRDEARQALQEIANGDMRTSRARARQALGKTTHTPETDAAEMPIDRVDTVASRPCHIVNSEFARKLERERNQWRECAEKLAAVLRDADVLVTNATDDGRRDWHGDIGWLRGQQTAIIIDRPPEEELTEFDRLKEGSK